MTTKNNIPAGYKDSAVGIIPQEWKVKQLALLGKIFSGGTPSTDKEEYWGGNIMWCTPSDITSISSKYINNTKDRITAMGLKNSSAILLPINSIIVCTRATIGAAAITQVELSTNQGFKNIKPEKCNTEWLYYSMILNQPKLQRLGCGSTFLEVSKRDFERLKLAVPPLAEQRKIAEILGVWDEAIEKQSRLIEKLELRKRGLMQHLLTGRTRLPGFTYPWQKVKLGEIAQIKKGVQVNKDTLQEYGKYPTINGGIEPSGYSDNYNTEANTITISEGGNSCGYVNFITTKFWSGGHCYTIIPNNNVIKPYLFQQLKHSEPHIMDLRVGSGLPNIQLKTLTQLRCSLPSLPEQKAIAEVLTAADNEIASHRKKLDALRFQKRGLMQQLLTGKTRVKI